MAEDLISSIVDPKAYKQIDDLTAKLALSQKALIDNVDAAIKLNATLGNSKTLPQMEKNATAAAIAMEKLKQSEINTELAQGRLTAAQVKATQQQEKQTRATSEQEREYVKLNKTLLEATKRAQDIGIAYGKNSPQFAKAAKEVKQLRDNFVAVDAALGIHNRNVGNYTNSIRDALYNLLPFGSQLGRVAHAAEEVAGVVANSTLSISRLGLALGTIPFAAAAIGFSGLIAYFATTQEGMDKVRYAVEPFKIALKQAFGELQEFGRSTVIWWDRVRDRMGESSIGKRFAPKPGEIGSSRDRPAVLQYAGEFATEEDVKQMKERDELAKKIVDTQIQIRKNDAEQVLQKAKLLDIQKLATEQARNTDNSEEERIRQAKIAIGALNEWMTLETKDIQLKLKLVDLQQSITKEARTSDTAIKERNTVLAEIYQLEAETAQKRIRLTSIINKTEKSSAKDQEDADKKALKAIQDKAEAQQKYFEQQIKDARLILDNRRRLADLEVQLQKQTADRVGEINKKNLEAQQATLNAFSKMLEDNAEKEKKLKEKTAEEDEERRERRYESILEHESQAFDIITAFLSRRFELESQTISNLEKSQQETFDAESERIRASLLSDQDKANKLAILESQRASQAAQNDRKEREIAIRRAKFDKETALFEIAIRTATNIIKLLLTPPLAIAAAVAGAAQAAVVLATPLPKFKEGGKMHQTGLAEYGHGQELRIDPDGKLSLTGSTPEIGLVKKGTEFISNKELVRMMAKPDQIVYAGGQAIDIKELVDETRKGSKRIENAINSQQQQATGIRYYSTSKGRSYLKRNIN